MKETRFYTLDTKEAGFKKNLQNLQKKINRSGEVIIEQSVAGDNLIITTRVEAVSKPKNLLFDAIDKGESKNVFGKKVLHD